MSTETNDQQAKTVFKVTLTHPVTEAELQAGLDAYFNRDKPTPDTEPQQVTAQKVYGTEFASTDDAAAAIELLETYVETALPYQHPLHLLYSLATDHGDSEHDDLGDGFWDYQSFFTTLTRHFLNPVNAEAYIESGGGRDELSSCLPDLQAFFTELANSSHTDALLETVRYKRKGLSMKKNHHDKIMSLYSSKLESYEKEREINLKAA